MGRGQRPILRLRNVKSEGLLKLFSDFFERGTVNDLGEKLEKLAKCTGSILVVSAS